MDYLRRLISELSRKYERRQRDNDPSNQEIPLRENRSQRSQGQDNESPAPPDTAGSQVRSSRDKAKKYHHDSRKPSKLEFNDSAEAQESAKEIEGAIITCEECGARNRLRKHRKNEAPVCGRCGAPIEDPEGTVTVPEDINDAFTGEKIDRLKEVFQCRKCSVYYHRESLELIRKENSGHCISCGNRAIEQVRVKKPRRRPERMSQAGRAARNREVPQRVQEPKAEVKFSPYSVTIHNYREYMGRMVTFEGFVYCVSPSSDGKAYGAMFEKRSWGEGLKMLVLKNYLPLVGGADFLKSLEGKVIQIKGLLSSHPFYGDEILVTDSKMILEIRQNGQ